MTRRIFCTRLQREAEGLDKPPWPGTRGQRIYESVSKEAWYEWLAHQTMLLNENRLSSIDPKARAFLIEEMEKYLFAGHAEKPAGYTPEPQ